MKTIYIIPDVHTEESAEQILLKGGMFNASFYAKELGDILETLTPETQRYLLTMARELLSLQEKLLEGNQGSDTSVSR